MNATYPGPFKMEPWDLLPNADAQLFDHDQALYSGGRGQGVLDVVDLFNQRNPLLLVWSHFLETKSLRSSCLSRESRTSNDISIHFRIHEVVLFADLL